MSITTELTRLASAKTEIADAITAKGVTVPGDTKMDGFPALISQIAGGGAPEVPRNDVTFYDYDGTVVAAYTIAEAQSLAALPAAPAHAGLTFQGWNYTLAQVNATTRPMDIGAIYIPTDGKTHLHVEIWDVARPNISLYFNQTESNGVAVDWGDGSILETSPDIGDVYMSHTFTTSGRFDISMDVAEGCELLFGHGNEEIGLFGQSWNDSDAFICKEALLEVNVGERVPTIGPMSFAACYRLQKASIPDGVVEIGTYAFSLNSAATFIALPPSVLYINESAFDAWGNAKGISLAEGLLEIGPTAFGWWHALARICIPLSVESLGDLSLAYLTYAKEIHLKSYTPPAIEWGTFTGMLNDTVICVPASALSAYQNDQTWIDSNLVQYLQGV